MCNLKIVVVATTKVHIFKQITTITKLSGFKNKLLLLPQRYIFSSKSQLINKVAYICVSCCCYHKGTYFQANHNNEPMKHAEPAVVVATTKVHIFKQITTHLTKLLVLMVLLLLPQRYIFSSKSQPKCWRKPRACSCCCYHKGTYFQANHNLRARIYNARACCCCYHKGTYFQANHNWIP